MTGRVRSSHPLQNGPAHVRGEIDIRHKAKPQEIAKPAEVQRSEPPSWFPVRALYRAIRDSVRASHANRDALALLLVVNIYTIAVAIYQHWPPQNVFLLYWLQSIVIGVFQSWKLIFWKNISFVEDGYEAPPSRKTVKAIKVTYFILAFFGAHAVLLKAFDVLFDLANTDLLTTFATVRFTFSLLVVNHAVSFILNYRRDTEVPTTYAEIFGNTFIRIVPLHLWPAYFMLIFVPTSFALFIAYFAGVNEQVLSRISSVIPGVAVVLFMLIKGVFEIPAHLLTHSDVKLTATRAPGCRDGTT